MKAARNLHQSAQDHLEAGDFENALRLAEAGLRLSPDDGRLWETRGIALGGQGDVTGAVSCLERAATAIPLSACGQVVLASCYLRTRNLQSAECIYEFLATRDDVPAHLMADIAEGLALLGRLELALDVCWAAYHRAPDCDSVLFAIAHYMTRLHRPVESVAAVMQQAFLLRPEKLLYRVDFALLLARCCRANEAYELLTDVDIAELLKVHCPPRLVGMARLFRGMGDDERAEACEARLLRLHDA